MMMSINGRGRHELVDPGGVQSFAEDTERYQEFPPHQDQVVVEHEVELRVLQVGFGDAVCRCELELRLE